LHALERSGCDYALQWFEKPTLRRPSNQATDRFSGTVKIGIQVKRPTSDIVLNTTDLEIRRFSVRTLGSGTATAAAVTGLRGGVSTRRTNRHVI
jgi:hypothetical protein